MSAFSIAVDLNVGILNLSSVDTLSNKLERLLETLHAINEAGMEGLKESLHSITSSFIEVNAELDRIARPRTATVHVNTTGMGAAQSAASLLHHDRTSASPLVHEALEKSSTGGHGGTLSSALEVTSMGLALTQVVHGFRELARTSGDVNAKLNLFRDQGGHSQEETDELRKTAYHVSAITPGMGVPDVISAYDEMQKIIPDHKPTVDTLQTLGVASMTNKMRGSPQTEHLVHRDLIQNAETLGLGKDMDRAMKLSLGEYIASGAQSNEITMIGRHAQTDLIASGMTPEQRAGSAAAWIQSNGAGSAASFKDFISLGGDRGVIEHPEFIGALMQSRYKGALKGYGIQDAVMQNPLDPNSRNQKLIYGNLMQDWTKDPYKAAQLYQNVAQDKANTIFRGVNKGKPADANQVATIGEQLYGKAVYATMQLGLKPTMAAQRERATKIINDVEHSSPQQMMHRLMDNNYEQAEDYLKTSFKSVASAAFDFKDAIKVMIDVAYRMGQAAAWLNDHPKVKSAVSTGLLVGGGVIGAGLAAAGAKRLGGIVMGGLGLRSAPATTVLAAEARVGGMAAAAAEMDIIGTAAAKLGGPLRLLGMVLLGFQGISWLFNLGGGSGGTDDADKSGTTAETTGDLKPPIAPSPAFFSMPNLGTVIDVTSAALTAKTLLSLSASIGKVGTVAESLMWGIAALPLRLATVGAAIASFATGPLVLLTAAILALGKLISDFSSRWSLPKTKEEYDKKGPPSYGPGSPLWNNVPKEKQLEKDDKGNYKLPNSPMAREERGDYDRSLYQKLVPKWLGGKPPSPSELGYSPQPHPDTIMRMPKATSPIPTLAEQANLIQPKQQAGPRMSNLPQLLTATVPATDLDASGKVKSYDGKPKHEYIQPTDNIHNELRARVAMMREKQGLETPLWQHDKNVLPPLAPAPRHLGKIAPEYAPSPAVPGMEPTSVMPQGVTPPATQGAPNAAGTTSDDARPVGVVSPVETKASENKAADMHVGDLYAKSIIISGGLAGGNAGSGTSGGATTPDKAGPAPQVATTANAPATPGAVQGGLGAKTAASSESHLNIANQPFVPGKPLSKEQMAIVPVGQQMGITYPPDVMAQYNKQKAEETRPSGVSSPTPTSAETRPPGVTTPVADSKASNTGATKEDARPTGVASPVASQPDTPTKALSPQQMAVLAVKERFGHLGSVPPALQEQYKKQVAEKQRERERNDRPWVEAPDVRPPGTVNPPATTGDKPDVRPAGVVSPTESKAATDLATTKPDESRPVGAANPSNAANAEAGDAIAKRDDRPPGVVTPKGSPGVKTTASAESHLNIANQPVVPGKPLTKEQMAMVSIGQEMGNTYPPDVMAQYNKQRAEPPTKSDDARPAGTVSPTQSDSQVDAGTTKGDDARPAGVVNPPINAQDNKAEARPAGVAAPDTAPQGSPGVKSTSTSESHTAIAGQPVVPGKPLSQEQMDMVSIGQEMGNTYPPDVMAQYNKQRSQPTGDTRPAGVASATDAPSPSPDVGATQNGDARPTGVASPSPSSAADVRAPGTVSPDGAPQGSPGTSSVITAPKSSSKSYSEVNGEPVVPGQPLSKSQMSGIADAQKMGMNIYPPDVMTQYNKQNGAPEGDARPLGVASPSGTQTPATGTTTSDATTAYRPMLDMIGKYEGTDKGRGYNETLGYGAYTGGKVDLTKMTISQVEKLQQKMLSDPNNKMHSSAVGRYQVISGTLKDQVTKLGLNPDKTLYNAETQDKIGISLLKQRGADEFLSGKMDARHFRKNLSREWASVADPDTGRSHYNQPAYDARLAGIVSPLAAAAAGTSTHDNGSSKGRADYAQTAMSLGAQPQQQQQNVAAAATLQAPQVNGNNYQGMSTQPDPESYIHNVVNLDGRVLTDAVNRRMFGGAAAAGMSGISGPDVKVFPAAPGTSFRF